MIYSVLYFKVKKYKNFSRKYLQNKKKVVILHRNSGDIVFL